MGWREVSYSITVLAVVAAVSSATVGAAAGGASQPVLYLIGDSWSAGLHADPSRALGQDAAEDLGLSTMVDAESGTGYLNAPSGTRSYPDRAAAIPRTVNAAWVVVQGGSNDAGADRTEFDTAVERTVAAVQHALPDARVVLLGPGPDPWPITARQASIDAALQEEAEAMDVAYISPMQEHWFTADTVTSIIDPATKHPTVHGDVVLGRLLAADLRALVDQCGGVHGVGEPLLSVLRLPCWPPRRELCRTV